MWTSTTVEWLHFCTHHVLLKVLYWSSTKRPHRSYWVCVYGDGVLCHESIRHLRQSLFPFAWIMCWSVNLFVYWHPELVLEISVRYRPDFTFVYTNTRHRRRSCESCVIWSRLLQPLVQDCRLWDIPLILSASFTRHFIKKNDPTVPPKIIPWSSESHQK